MGEMEIYTSLCKSNYCIIGMHNIFTFCCLYFVLKLHLYENAQKLHYIHSCAVFNHINLNPLWGVTGGPSGAFSALEQLNTLIRPWKRAKVSTHKNQHFSFIVHGSVLNSETLSTNFCPVCVFVCLQSFSGSDWGQVGAFLQKNED